MTNSRAALSWEECVQLARFWSKVRVPKDEDHCWEWQGATLPTGYGVFRARRELSNIRAHRYSLELSTGEPIPDDMHVLHSCDNPPCVNPQHLRVGTDADNVEDMFKRKRNPRRGRLSDEEIIRMRTLRAQGSNLEELGATFGVAPSAVSTITRGLRWPEVGGPITSKNNRGSKKYV